MAKFFSLSLFVAASWTLFLAITPKTWSQIKTVYGAVHSLEDEPIAHTEIRTDTGASEVTTDSGAFGFPLVPPLKVGFPVTFYVFGWSIVEPCVLSRGRTYLPDPEAQEIAIKAVRKSDKRLLSRDSVGCLLVQKFAHFAGPPLPPTGLKPTVSSLLYPLVYPHSTIDFRLLLMSSYSTSSARVVFLGENQEATDDFIQRQASELGFTMQQLSSAIEDWAKSAKDPYEQGLAALFELRYSEASRLIQESINTSPKGQLDRYVSLARAEYEQKHYDAARSALGVALAVHPDDPLLQQNLRVIDLAQKDEKPANK